MNGKLLEIVNFMLTDSLKIVISPGGNDGIDLVDITYCGSHA